MNLRQMLETRISEALADAGAEDFPAMVSPSARPEFGDYQANGCMAAAKQLKTNPRKLAEQVAAAVAKKLAGVAETVEAAGPGFINVKLSNAWLGGELFERSGDGHLGAVKPEIPKTVVIDYSSPNIAKEMHVGHLRSTIIGDSLSRILDFLGHNVIRQNHVGDWGTQFGMVILAMWHIAMAEHRGEHDYISGSLKRLSGISPSAPVGDRREALQPIRDLHEKELSADWHGENVFYNYLKEVEKNRSLALDDLLPAYQFVNLVETLADGTGLTVESPPEHKPVPLQSVSRHITTMLQNRVDPRNEQEGLAWRYSRSISLEACEKIYEKLGIMLKREDVRGESDFHDDLPKVVEALKARGLLTESGGAQCVFLDQFRNKDNEPLPVIVQKTDGSYLYATTDLAAIRYRVGTLKANRIIYVTDSRQMLHFDMIFAVAREAGFAGKDVSLEHVPFGMMLGENGRPFKTREGGAVKLMDLLDEAEQRAKKLVAEKNPELTGNEIAEVAHKVGIGAVKYADLAHNRLSDYVFSWEKMLSLDGNTAPYMQYACARIRSIFRKGESVDCMDFTDVKIILTESAERSLAVKLMQFPEIVETVAVECTPHVLCGYLFELAGEFMGFYENCPVLKADEPTRRSRLQLCHLTEQIISKGLHLLGIETLEKM